MISYRDRELLDSIENGRLPDTLSDWLQLDKVKISEQSVKCAIIEKNREGVVLSTRIIDLKLQAHGQGFSKKRRSTVKTSNKGPLELLKKRKMVLLGEISVETETFFICLWLQRSENVF